MAKGSRNKRSKAKSSIVSSLDIEDILSDTHGFVASIERTSVDRRRVYQVPLPMALPSPPKKRRRTEETLEDHREHGTSDFVSLGIDESLFYNQALCGDAANLDEMSSKDKQAKRYNSSVRGSIVCGYQSDGCFIGSATQRMDKYGPR